VERPAAFFEYIKVFSSGQRLHAALDSQSPEQFEVCRIGKSNEVNGFLVRRMLCRIQRCWCDQIIENAERELRRPYGTVRGNSPKCAAH
jgi:hypothetical protein